MVLQTFFWERKSLSEMSEEEWESLCDGCGQCCLNKLIDEKAKILYFTNIACKQLDIKTCRCRHYNERFDYEENCIKLTRENVRTLKWMPKTCAYRLLSEGKPLFPWHPLLAGDKSIMHTMKISVRMIAVHEHDVVDWKEHVIEEQTTDSETQAYLK